METNSEGEGQVCIGVLDPERTNVGRGVCGYVKDGETASPTVASQFSSARKTRGWNKSGTRFIARWNDVQKAHSLLGVM